MTRVERYTALFLIFYEDSKSAGARSYSYCVMGDVRAIIITMDIESTRARVLVGIGQ